MNNSKHVYDPEEVKAYLAGELRPQRSALPPDDFSRRRMWIGKHSFSKKFGWVFVLAAAILLIAGTKIPSFLKSSRNSQYSA